MNTAYFGKEESKTYEIKYATFSLTPGEKRRHIEFFKDFNETKSIQLMTGKYFERGRVFYGIKSYNDYTKSDIITPEKYEQLITSDG
jgi:hypothetical protein